MGGVAANGDGATRTSAAMGSSSWAWRRAWRARSMARRPPKCRGGAGQPAHQWFRDGVRVAGGGRQPEDRGRIPTHRVEDGRPYRAQGRRPVGGIRDAVHVRRSHRDRRGRDQLQEGGYTYITVAVDHKRRRVAWAHDGYGKEVPGLFLRQPNAERVPDSFHIVSRMSDAPDQVRKRVRNQARRGNDKTATETMKGLKYAVPKNPEDLTERQDTALAALRDTDPRGQPYRSWQLKELLRTPLRQPVGQAGAGLERWIFRASHSRIPEIVELCRKTRRRKDDIPKTIRLGHSNARPEAFNNKIKVTIRMAYGFRHVDDLIAMIKLRCSGPPIHLPTPILQPTKTAESSYF